MTRLKVCAECGANRRWGTCVELFHTLLALDHERRQPWGQFHGLNMSCFLLQHPSMTSTSAAAGQWRLVTAFLSGGLAAAHHLESEQVRSNRPQSSRRPDSPQPCAVVEMAPTRSASPTVTIEDVAVDGTFPAAGYEDRMRAWAGSIATERVPR